MINRVAITGPECTGKTWLAKKLASHYKTNWVPEYAVEYLSKKGADYSLADILSIAKGQIYAETKLSENSTGFLFCDTDLIVTKIWSQVVFGTVDNWIIKMILEHKYDLYLLCKPDIEWKPGPFRENQYDRHSLFKLYLNELIINDLPYQIVEEDGEKRLNNAIQIINEKFNI